MAGVSRVTVSRTGVPAAIRVRPSEPVTFSVTLAVTVRPTLSRRELIESSRAAWISVPTRSVRVAAVVVAVLIPAAGLAVSATLIVSATLVEAVSEVLAVAAEEDRSVSGFELDVSGARATVSAGAAVAASFVVLDAVSLEVLVAVLSEAGVGSAAAGGA